jgi:hypothetical protein
MRRTKAALAMAAVALLGALGAAQPAGAAAGGLTNVSWLVSNTQTAAAATTYTFEFTTGTSGTVSSVTMTVPSDTAGTLAGVVNYGVGAGTVALSAGTITYTVATPANISAGTPIYISVSGLTNTATAAPFESTITTNTSTGLLDDYSSTNGTNSTVSFGASNTAVTAVVGKSILFTNDTPAGGFQWQLDPTVNTTGSGIVHLGVKTNAGQGYSLAVYDAGLKAGSYQIGAAPGGGTSTAPPANSFGYAVSLAGGGTSLAAVQPAGLSGGKFMGYTLSGAPTTAVTATKPTGNTADTMTVTNKVVIDYSSPAGSYADTITYVVTPTY